MTAENNAGDRRRRAEESVLDWVWEFDPGGLCTYVSPRVTRSLGRDPAEIVGKAMFEMMAPDEGRRGSGTVLVVDDEETVRNLAAKALQAAGFSVRLASDGGEALEIYRRHAAEIVAVLLDLTMPGIGGEETFRELRHIHPDVAVLLSSGNNEQEVTDRFAGKGLAAFIQKPYRVVELLAKLRTVLEK